MAAVSVALKKIDAKGAVTGVAMAFVIWLGTGELALLALFMFFTIGTLASSWKKSYKAQLKLEQENEGKRGIKNVLANGGVAGIISFCAFIIPEYHFEFFIMTTTVFASACSDTLSSELGNIYGRNYFSIISFKPGRRGQDGVVSIQGFFFGIIGSGSIAALPMFILTDWKYFIIILVAGFSGNVMDSVLGATLQQNGKLSNHEVNFWSTTFAALLSFLFLFILKIS